MRVDGKVIMPESKTTVHNIILLDSSGSMSGAKYRSAINSINGELTQYKLITGVNYTQTIIEFSTIGTIFDYKLSTTEHYFLQPIAEVNYFHGRGANGGTPLNQVVGETIERLLTIVKPEDRVIISIFTDGQDNNSQGKYPSYAPQLLKDLIERVKEENKWTITFQGTQQDIDQVVSGYGILRSNTFAHKNTAESIEEGVKFRTAATMNFTAAVAGGASADSLVGNFYSKTVIDDKDGNKTTSKIEKSNKSTNDNSTNNQNTTSTN